MGKPRKATKRREEEAPLHAAARTGDLVTVQSICSSNRVAINSRDKHSRTPLHLAAWSGHTEVVSYLCKNKADAGASAMDDMGAIHFASQKGHLEVVRILLSSGVSVKAVNRKGLTPLHYAVQGSHLELVKYLVRKGATLGAKTKSGKTPLDLANSEEVRSLLVECEQSSEKGEEHIGSNEVDESAQEKPKPADERDAGLEVDESGREKPGDCGRDVHSGGEDVAKHAEVEERDEGVKRKVRESESESKAGSSRPKKARVALDHLLAGNDMQEDEEE